MPVKFGRLAALLLWVGGCTSTATEPREPAPPFDAQFESAFNDSLPTSAFGILESPGAPDKDVALARAAQTADAILPVKLLTVAADEGRGEVQFTLSFEVHGEPIVGAWPEPLVSVAVGPHTPTSVLLEKLDTRVVGQELILFLKRLEHPEGTSLHFRAEMPGQAVLDAIQGARAELSP